MCGVAGVWSPTTTASKNESDSLRMAERLGHRGPDDSGNWSDPESGFAVAHRRLSIIDLSAKGHQPMISASGRWVLAYNGEIYNHLELRRQLETSAAAPSWRGHSDTESLLACIDAWGIETTLARCVGMFAMALWDREERGIVLARDRMGEKPLYYGWQNETFLFGSELKALRAHPSFHAEISNESLTLLLRRNCIPAPHTVYKGIFKLMPGHFLRISTHRNSPSGDSAPTPYWRLNDAVENGLTEPFAGSETEAIDALEKQLSKSIEAQMLADVPLGAFLSGGTDSSAVVALMQAQSSQAIKTFTVGFDEADYDEAANARSVAEHLGTEHTELYVRPQDALDLIPSLPSVFCEPFGDSSQIPTFLVSQLTRQHVTVALSGDAGDELFGGYNRYLMARNLWTKMRTLPKFVRQAAARTLGALPPAKWDKVFAAFNPVIPRRLRVTTPGEKVQKLAAVLTMTDDHAFFNQLTSHWGSPADVVVNAPEPSTLITDQESWPKVDCFEHWMMAIDAQTYLPDDILVKVDRASMANSLETRMPMLDHRVVELAWRMPLDFKIRNGQGKWLLRQVLNRHVPKELTERPKMGFGIPLDSWLRGSLRDWAENLLDERKLRTGGYFHPEPIRTMWAEHLSGKRNRQFHLWSVLMFQAWLEAQDTSA